MICQHSKSIYPMSDCCVNYPGFHLKLYFLGNGAYTEFKGAIAENYVLQSLVPQYDILPRYWTSIGKAEVDFVIQSGSEIIPVEVKAQTRLGR